MYSLKRTRTLFAVLFGLFLALVSSPGSGQVCGTKGEWKDIYILPTNGDWDNNIRLSLKADKTHVQPGDTITLSFESSRDCYVTIMDMGTSGRIVRLWPNQYSAEGNFVPAHAARSFPSASDRFLFRIGGPGGVERIIAYATSEPGKILSEAEFQGLQNSPFKQFVGGAKDLATTFKQGAESLGSQSKWGTAQVNICIGAETSSLPSDSAAASSTIYLLSVGATTGQLKYCKRDAQRFSDVMKEKLGIKESNLRLILGADATYDGFSNGLNWLASISQPEDRVIIYFSGHGSSIPDQPPLDEDDRKDECFVLYPGEGRDYMTAIRNKTLMVDDDFNLRLKKIPARQKVLVADCCHSGTIHKALGNEPQEVVSKYLPLRDPATGAQMEWMGAKSTPTNYGNDNEAILAACMDNQSSYEVNNKQAGLFTHYLLEAIRGEAEDLEKAFEIARASTQRESDGFARQSAGKHTNQTPNLTDPHGFVKLFRFSR